MRIPVWMVALAAAAVVGSGVGCSGGGDDDDDDDDDGSSLSSGTYVVSNAATTTDECDFGDISTLDGAELNVTATATTVTIDGLFSSPLDHDLVGSSFDSVVNGTSQYDWNDPAVWQAEGLSGPYNCVENDTIAYGGDITSQTSFTYTFSVMYTLSSGDAAACQMANNSAGYAITTFPCNSDASFDAAI